MLARLIPLPVLAAMALATSLSAQESPEAPAAETPAPEATAPEAPAAVTPAAPAETPATDPAAEPAAPAEGAAEGEVASADPQVGEPYLREEFGDWSLRCLRAEEGPDPCQLYQLLLDVEGNAVAEISMFPLPEGQTAVAGATIVAPLETLLTEELTLSVDGTASRRYPFTFCNQAGCVARVGFTAEEIAEFKGGNSAQLSIVPAAAPDERVELVISLSGFTAGYDSSDQVPAPQ